MTQGVSVVPQPVSWATWLDRNRGLVEDMEEVIKRVSSVDWHGRSGTITTKNQATDSLKIKLQLISHWLVIG